MVSTYRAILEGRSLKTKGIGAQVGGSKDEEYPRAVFPGSRTVMSCFFEIDPLRSPT